MLLYTQGTKVTPRSTGLTTVARSVLVVLWTIPTMLIVVCLTSTCE
jgi:hypothetical protein